MQIDGITATDASKDRRQLLRKQIFQRISTECVLYVVKPSQYLCAEFKMLVV